MRRRRSGQIAGGAALLALALAGCGGGGGRPPFSPGSTTTVSATTPRAAQQLGIPALATKNTTRIAGADPVADAAGVAQAVYPSQSAATRPAAAILADSRDWRAALAASVLVAAPVQGAMLLGSGSAVAPATAAALKALKPVGASSPGSPAVIRVGNVPPAPHSIALAGADPATLAAAVDSYQTKATGKPSASVVVVSEDAPAFAMPAAGWAARSGDPILFVTKSAVPAATAKAIRGHGHAHVYVLGPASVISDAVVKSLGKLAGPVTRISGPDPVTNAIAFARYSDASFGWGIKDPGHGLVFASAQRPLDAAAAAPLSAAGTFGPLLVVDRPGPLPAALSSYLLDIQPGYAHDPTRGVYNHGWLIGDPTALSVPTQASIDSLLEIAPVKSNGAP